MKNIENKFDDSDFAGKELNSEKAKLLKNQKINRRSEGRFNLRNIGNTLGVLMLVGAIGYCGYNIALNRNAEKKLKEAYNTALQKYAEFDGKEGISDLEKNRFYREILEKNSINYEPGRWPRYSDGKDVPIKELTRWIEEYRPESE